MSTDRLAEPLVSICVSAYDVERYLPETLESILGQTYENLEIILVDNGSVDGTFEVAQAVEDARFRCFRLPENIGGYQAMNLVASQARGELVAVYHSDDVYEPTIVEREVSYLQSHPEAGAVFTMCSFIDESGSTRGGLDLVRELRGLERVRYEDVFPAMLKYGNVMFVCPSFMVRREVFEAVGPFDAETWDIASDQEMWLRMTRKYPVGILDERLLRYRITQQQWTHRWKHLRTVPNRALDVMELYMRKDRWPARLRDSEIELRYQRCDDETTRAANAVILGDAAQARRLLAGRYPYAALRNLDRRKARVLALRGLLKGALSVRAYRPLARVLRATEYGEWR
jgi:glycosyltransferase involved in cell wall biosynthesis